MESIYNILVHSYTICCSLHEQAHNLAQTHITYFVVDASAVPSDMKAAQSPSLSIVGNDLVGPKMVTVATHKDDSATAGH
jgi:hypothetical protein